MTTIADTRDAALALLDEIDLDDSAGSIDTLPQLADALDDLELAALEALPEPVQITATGADPDSGVAPLTTDEPGAVTIAALAADPDAASAPLTTTHPPAPDPPVSPITTATDYDTLNEAVAATDGGVCFVPPGTYPLDSTLAVDCTLIGAGPAVVTLDVTTEMRNAIQISADGARVEGLSIAGNDRTQRGVNNSAGYDDVTIERVHVDACTQYGSTTRFSAGICTYGTRTRIRECVVERISAPNRGVSRGIIAEGSGHDTVIADCTVDDITPRDDGDGIVIQGAQDGARIVNNHVTNAAKSALKINCGATKLAVTATGNTLSAADDCLCVARIQGTRTTFTGNTLINDRVGDAVLRVATNPGNEPQPVTVTANVLQLTDAGRHDDLIRVRHTDRGVVIANNALRSGENAVWVDDSERVVVSGNAIEGCANFGVFFNGTHTGAITGNTIADCGGEGIYTQTGTRDVTVTGNTLVDTGGTRFAGDNIQRGTNIVL